MSSADVLPALLSTPVHSHSISHTASHTHIIQVQTGNKQNHTLDNIVNNNKSHAPISSGNTVSAAPTTVHTSLPRPHAPTAATGANGNDRPALHIHTQPAQLQPQSSNVQVLNAPSNGVGQMHVKVTPPGTLDLSEYSEGDYDSEDDYDDDGSSEDKSPRENRVLTFADEHGANLCDFCYYEPEPAEHDDSIYEHYQQPVREMQPTGCFACLMPRIQQTIKT